MAAKYVCTRCDRRFVEWGAEKIRKGEGCDECRGEDLELIGFDATQAAAKKKPSLKRKSAKAAAAPAPIKLSSVDDGEPNAPDLGNIAGSKSTSEIGVINGFGEAEPSAAANGLNDTVTDINQEEKEV